jgi:hypothetical protein
MYCLREKHYEILQTSSYDVSTMTAPNIHIQIKTMQIDR